MLHDVGYAPGVRDTGFHPLDYASYLAGRGANERVVNLVARHSYAFLEAKLRGVGRGDLTTSPDGEPASAGERIVEVEVQYGLGDIATRFIGKGGSELLPAVGRGEHCLAREQAMAPTINVRRSTC